MHVRILLVALAALIALPASAQNQPDIVDIAAGSDDFETLVAAVTAADLVETLQSDGPFTVFAPNDAAFGLIDSDAIEALLRPENRDQLTAILTYHVVAGRFTAAELAQVDEVRTVNGQTLEIGTRINDAGLLATDIEASNGIIHVIDRVLMPEMPRQRRSSHH
ncbi:MAG: fasciclin domain-containing protein [Rubricoccaceae bacterium]